MTCAGESQLEGSTPTNLLSIKADTRTLYGKVALIAKEMTWYDLKGTWLKQPFAPKKRT